MSLYKNVFADSFKLTWKNKYFWLLGVFTVFFSTSVELDMFDNFLGPNRNNLLYDYYQVVTGAGSFYQKTWYTLILLSILVFLLIISAIAQIIITGHSASLLKSGRNNLKVPAKFNLISNLKRTSNLILPVSALNVALKLFVSVILILIAWSVNSVFNWVYLALFIVLFPLVIVLAFITRFVTSYIIIQGQSLGQALKNGFFLFRANWLVSTEMSLMLFLVNVFGSLFIIFVILAIANPLWFIGIVVNQYIYKGGFYVILAISYVVFFFLFAWGASLLSVFNITAWTGLFVRLEKTGGESKLIRVLSDLIK